MNVDSILLSEYANTTQHGRLTVVNVFNSMSAQDVPVRVPLMSISLVIHGHADEAGSEHTCEIHLLDQDRNPVGDDPIRFDFTMPDGEPPPGMPLRHVVARRFIGLTLQEQGTYAFEVYIDGTYHTGTAFHLQVGED